MRNKRRGFGLPQQETEDAGYLSREAVAAYSHGRQPME
jgi:hypothetical protein